MANPSFLFVELAAEHANQVGVLEQLAGTVRSAGGDVLAWAPPSRISCLEPGTVASGILLARWPEPGATMSVATGKIVSLLASAVPAHSTPLVLAVNGLPERGLPEMMEIPTVASVPMAPKSPRNALMVIRGSVSDQTRIDGYRDVRNPWGSGGGAGCNYSLTYNASTCAFSNPGSNANGCTPPDQMIAACK